MPGKWSGLRGTVPAAPVDADYQARLNARKAELQQTLTSTTDKARLYCQLRDQKDAYEDKIKKLNLDLEALSQLMIAEMEQQGTDLFRLDTGDSLSIKDEPYSGLEDRGKFLNWIRETGQDDLLSVHYMTMNSMVKDVLQNGGNIPPGIKVFIRQSITRRRGRQSE